MTMTDEGQYWIIDEGDDTVALARYDGAESRVLARMGDPKRNAAALQILGQSLGIPARAWSEDPDIHGSMVTAIQLVANYGMMPGTHFHAVPRNKKVKNPQGQDAWVETWTIQVGEKAWKDSAHRHGTTYRIQHKPMTKEELDVHCRSRGMPAADVSPHATGVWARVITKEEIEWGLVTEDSPVWAAGTWTGLIEAGYKWRQDGLPTGTTPADVAVRRADKRALMQSTLTLIPLDERHPDERLNALADNLAERVDQQEEEQRSILNQQRRYRDDDNGDIIFAVDPGPVNGNGAQPPAPEDGDGDNPFDDVPQWTLWKSPPAAQAWAVEVGACANEHEARASFKKIVDAQFGGSLKRKDMPEVFRLYWERQQEKLAERLPVAA